MKNKQELILVGQKYIFEDMKGSARMKRQCKDSNRERKVKGKERQGDNGRKFNSENNINVKSEQFIIFTQRVKVLQRNARQK